jgi:aspartate/glutamate racemase
MRTIPPLPAAASPQPVLGILGGMGPVASAAFVRSLYREAAFRREQAAPACILLPSSSACVRSGMSGHARLVWVFALKAQRRPRAVLDGIGEMMARYGADRWISGCTEFHLAGNALRARGHDPATIIDPLHVVACRLACFMAPPPVPAVLPLRPALAV